MSKRTENVRNSTVRRCVSCTDPFEMIREARSSDMSNTLLQDELPGAFALEETVSEPLQLAAGRTVQHLIRFFDYRSDITDSRAENVNSYDEIEHPATRNAMQMLDMHELRLTYDAELPARSGLGTSISFAMEVLNAFYA